MEKSFSRIDKILITGLPRTGTTFFGNILGSCENLEYFFEPVMINKLFSFIEKIDEPIWKDIFEEYCLNELLANSIAGRRLNFNPHDDSHIFNYKSQSEINERLDKSWRAAELDEKIYNYTLSFKTPGVSNYLKKIIGYYPNWKLVVVFRNYEDILNSILAKGWFNDEIKNTISPYKVIKGSKIPIVVSLNWHNQWSNLNEIERAMVYMNEQLEYLSKLEDYTRIDYNKFIEDPNVLLEYLKLLKVKPTTKTFELLTTIRKNEKDNSHLLKSKISNSILSTAHYFKAHFNI